MREMHSYKYEKHMDLNQETRFATEEEILGAGKKIGLYDRELASAGMPLWVHRDEAIVNTKDQHNLILGATGSGKTRRLILLMLHLLLHTNSSLLVVDVKGLLRRMTSGLAKAQGFKVITLDLKEFKHCDCWNPLDEPYRLYHTGEKELANEMLADFMAGLAAAQEKSTFDIFWTGMAKALGNANLQLMLECLPKELCNVANFVELCSEGNYKDLLKLSKQLAYQSRTASSYRGVFSAAEKTRQSIEVTLFEMVRLFTLNETMTRMLSKSTFDMHQIGRGKTIVYLEIADEKPTYHAIVGMFIKQMYEVLVKDANGYPEERLPIPVYFVIDEFCNIPRIENMANIITAARSRNIFLTLVVQSYKQLEGLYGEDADTIKGNCQNWYYLFSRELAMLNEVSELCGEIITADGGRRRLISTSELQRLKMGEMLIMHDRLYPYLTYFPDISEYQFKTYLPVRRKPIPPKNIEIVDLKKLLRLIERKKMPVPFSSEIPAVDMVDGTEIDDDYEFWERFDYD